MKPRMGSHGEFHAKHNSVLDRVPKQSGQTQEYRCHGPRAYSESIGTMCEDICGFLLCSILISSVLFYPILLYSILICSVLICTCLGYSILCESILESSRTVERNI